MPVSFPVALGILTGLWSVHGWLLLPATGTPRLVLGFVAGLAALGALLLVARREERAAASMVAVAAAINVAFNAGRAEPTSELLLVFAVIVAVTVGHADEREALLRTLVTSVYLYTALSKLNPSFLAGEQLAMVVTTRPQLGWAAGFVEGRAAVGLAVLTIAVEIALAGGLWVRRTRRATATVGVAVHLAFTLGVGRGVDGVAALAILNFGLVAAYPAFFALGQRPRRRLSRRRGSAAPPPLPA